MEVSISLAQLRNPNYSNQTKFLLSRSLIDSWNPNPIPKLSLSAAGLLVLADLHTIAQRTAITGGSSWLDALVLAPGLHYQQAADALDRDNGSGLFAELARAAMVDSNQEADKAPPSPRFAITNTVTVNYLKRLFRDKPGTEDTFTIDVRSLVAAKKAGYSLSRSMSDLLHRAQRAAFNEQDHPPDFAWISHSLFLATPILTTAAIVFSILLEEWWTFSSIIALMVSRILNIWAIKQRSAAPSCESKSISPEDIEKANKATEYIIDLGMGRRVVLRGSECDLQAVTTQPWMRNKTDVEGFCEAIAKLIVYMVAAFSGNMTQVGSFLIMALLLISAGCLGLSNTYVDGFKMHGRVARPERKDPRGLVIGAEMARELMEQQMFEVPSHKVLWPNAPKEEVADRSGCNMPGMRQTSIHSARPTVVDGPNEE